MLSFIGMLLLTAGLFLMIDLIMYVFERVENLQGIKSDEDFNKGSERKTG
jgi:hypothetical protein